MASVALHYIKNGSKCRYRIALAFDGCPIGFFRVIRFFDQRHARERIMRFHRRKIAGNRYLSMIFLQLVIKGIIIITIDIVVIYSNNFVVFALHGRNVSMF